MQLVGRDEQWFPIPTHPHIDISTYGRIRTRKTGLIRKLYMDQRRQELCVGLRGGLGRQKAGAFRVRALMMLTFAERVPSEKNVVIRHKDGDASNCRIDNLYFATRREVMLENYRLGKMKGTYKFQKGNKINKWKPGPLHPRWNPSSPHHLREYRKKQLTKT